MDVNRRNAMLDKCNRMFLVCNFQKTTNVHINTDTRTPMLPASPPLHKFAVCSIVAGNLFPYNCKRMQVMKLYRAVKWIVVR